MTRLLVVLALLLSACSASKAPERWQAISFHDVQVMVPASWKGEDISCGSPRSNTWSIDRGGVIAAILCTPAHRPRPYVLVRLSALEPDPRGTQRNFPSSDVSVSVQGADKALTARILGSARVISKDALGCPTHVSTVTVGAQSGSELLPAGDTGATLCRYLGDFLVQSAVDNTLPAYVRGLAPGQTRSSGRSCDTTPGRGILLHVHYPAGDRLLQVVLTGCPFLYVTDGPHEAKVTFDAVNLLTSQVGYDGGTPNPDDYH